MKALQHHIYGIKASFDTLSKGQLLVFFIPGLVIGIWYFWSFLIIQELHTEAEIVNSVPWIGGYIASGIHGILNFGETILYEFFKFFVLTLLSPFNCVLSERFDTQLTGRKFQTGFMRIVNDFLRMILVVMIALFLEFFIMGFWAVFSWVVGLGILNSIVYFLISSFFLGFAFYDYSLERHGIGTLRSLGFAFAKMGYMLLTGGIFTILFMIPVAGVILAPVLATMISTAAYIKLKEKPAPPPELQNT